MLAAKRYFSGDDDVGWEGGSTPRSPSGSTATAPPEGVSSSSIVSGLVALRKQNQAVRVSALKVLLKQGHATRPLAKRVLPKKAACETNSKSGCTECISLDSG